MFDPMAGMRGRVGQGVASGLLALGLAACGPGGGSGGGDGDGGSGSDATSSPTSAVDTSVTATGADATGSATGADVDCDPAGDMVLTPVWDFETSAATTGGDAAGAFALEPGGDIYVAGTTGSGDLEDSIWLRRLTTDGAEVWASMDVAPPQSLVEVVTVAPGGSVFTAGSTFINDPSYGLTSALFVGAYDLDGQLQWTDDTPTDPPNPFTQASAATVTPEGDLVIGGNAGSGGGYLRRYDAAGNVVWTVPTIASVAALAGGADGALFVATVAGIGSSLERWDDAGTMVWSVPGPGQTDANYFGSRATAVAVTSDGGPVFVGTIDYLVGSPKMPTDSWTTLFVRRLDPGGVETWTSIFDHVGYSQMSLAVHPDDRVTVANREMDESTLVRRLDAAGTLQWTDTLPCPGGAWRVAPIDSDLLVSGTLPTPMQSTAAFVGRFAG